MSAGCYPSLSTATSRGQAPQKEVLGHRMRAQPPDYGIGAVTRTAALVAAMVRLGPSPLTLLAAEAGCTAATAFRILHTLSMLGLAAQHGRRGPWQLGVGWLAVARAARHQGAIPLAAQPILEAVAEQCGEAVSFAILDGEQCEVVAAHPATPPVRAFTSVGARAPLHAGPGRLLLAHAPLAVQRAVLASRLVRLGPATRTDAAGVGADLPLVAARGWLITTDEIGDGAITVSQVVKDGKANLIGVLSVVAPSVRLRSTRPQIFLPVLAEAAAELGRALG